jgi:hypothetical protein
MSRLDADEDSPDACHLLAAVAPEIIGMLGASMGGCGGTLKSGKLFHLE